MAFFPAGLMFVSHGSSFKEPTWVEQQELAPSRTDEH